MEKYDVVIAGAGIAGASAAYFISRKGFKVLLTDVKPFQRAGDKPCGDAIGKHHLDELGIEYPRNDELEGMVRGIDVYSPSEGMKYRVLGEGFEVNRVAFTQRFIRQAMDNGAEYLQETQVKDLIVKDGVVKGAVLWSREKGSWEVATNLLVDATGMSRALIRKAPSEWPIRDELNPTEMNIAYREIRELKNDIEEPEILRIYVSKDKAPGGYWWFFPYSMKPRTVNVGLGVQGGRGYPHPKDLLYTKVLSRTEFHESKIVESGGAAVPTRRPVNTLVWNGIAAIGDAKEN
jgi:digeranylgeranylglycerophospholipid reductase